MVYNAEILLVNARVRAFKRNTTCVTCNSTNTFLQNYKHCVVDETYLLFHVTLIYTNETHFGGDSLMQPTLLHVKFSLVTLARLGVFLNHGTHVTACKRHIFQTVYCFSGHWTWCPRGSSIICEREYNFLEVLYKWQYSQHTQPCWNVTESGIWQDTCSKLTKTVVYNKKQQL